MENKQDEIVALLERLVEKMESPQHEEEHQYIRLAMAREAKREKLYDAIIEKSIAGLAWAFLVAVGSSVWMYIKDHLK
jgi:hypothetical protein